MTELASDGDVKAPSDIFVCSTFMRHTGPTGKWYRAFHVLVRWPDREDLYILSQWGAEAVAPSSCQTKAWPSTTSLSHVIELKGRMKNGECYIAESPQKLRSISIENRSDEILRFQREIVSYGKPFDARSEGVKENIDQAFACMARIALKREGLTADKFKAVVTVEDAPEKKVEIQLPENWGAFG